MSGLPGSECFDSCGEWAEVERAFVAREDEQYARIATGRQKISDTMHTPGQAHHNAQRALETTEQSVSRELEEIRYDRMDAEALVKVCDASVCAVAGLCATAASR